MRLSGSAPASLAQQRSPARAIYPSVLPWRDLARVPDLVVDFDLEFDAMRVGVMPAGGSLEPFAERPKPGVDHPMGVLSGSKREHGCMLS